MRRALSLGLALVLCGCVAPQKISRAQRDKARLDRQQDERAAYDRCNQDAVPGSAQHLACRMGGAK